MRLSAFTAALLLAADLTGPEIPKPQMRTFSVPDEPQKERTKDKASRKRLKARKTKRGF